MELLKEDLPVCPRVGWAPLTLLEGVGGPHSRFHGSLSKTFLQRSVEEAGCSLCSARTSWDLPWAHRQVFSRCLITMGLGYTLALNWASVICWRLLLWCSWVQELVGMICEGKFMVIVESGCIPLLCSLYKLKISEKYSRRVTIFQ